MTPDAATTAKLEGLLNHIVEAWQAVDAAMKDIVSSLFRAYAAVPREVWADVGVDGSVKLGDLADGWAAMHFGVVGQYITGVVESTAGVDASTWMDYLSKGKDLVEGVKDAYDVAKELKAAYVLYDTMEVGWVAWVALLLPWWPSRGEEDGGGGGGGTGLRQRRGERASAGRAPGWWGTGRGLGWGGLGGGRYHHWVCSTARGAGRWPAPGWRTQTPCLPSKQRVWIPKTACMDGRGLVAPPFSGSHTVRRCVDALAWSQVLLLSSFL